MSKSITVPLEEIAGSFHLQCLKSSKAMRYMSESEALDSIPTCLERLRFEGAQTRTNNPGALQIE